MLTLSFSLIAITAVYVLINMIGMNAGLFYPANYNEIEAEKLKPKLIQYGIQHRIRYHVFRYPFSRLKLGLKLFSFDFIVIGRIKQPCIHSDHIDQNIYSRDRE